MSRGYDPEMRIDPIEVYERCRECGDRGSHRVVVNPQSSGWEYAQILCDNCGCRIRWMPRGEYNVAERRAEARDN